MVKGDKTFLRDWKVLLVGGNSGTGKTQVARRLAQRFETTLAEVDDFRLMLERITNPSQQPTLHNFLNALANPATPALELCELLIAVGETVSNALEIVIANHVATNTPVILEGDGLLPALANRQTFAELATGSAVKAVFLIEDEEEILFRNMAERQRGFEQQDETLQKRQVKLSWLYGQWLEREARRFELPVIRPRPWNTLLERIVVEAGLVR